MKDVSVIIVAAGSASRMKGVDKQWMPLNGMPVVLHSIRAFAAVESVREIIIAAKADDVIRMKQAVSEYSKNIRVIVTKGGDSRQASVENGFRQCTGTNGLVAIHDGARPVITGKDIEAVIAAAREYGAATLGVKVKETVKVVGRDNMIAATPDRSALYLTQTPQVFEWDAYRKGLGLAAQEGLDFTDDCQLMEAIGVPVRMVDGNYGNIKITTPEDIRLAKALMEDKKKGMCI